jgi:hypothetical protein
MRVTPHSNGWSRYQSHDSGSSRPAGPGADAHGSRPPDVGNCGYTYEADYTRIPSDDAPSDTAEHAHVAQARPCGRIPAWAISAIYHYGELGSEPPVGKHIDMFV